MKILPNLLTCCCLVLLLLSLSSCSSRNKASLPHGGTQVAAYDEEERVPSEPEETADEELEALNRPGAWEYGINKVYSLEKLGIDPSKYDFPIMVNKQVLYYLELFQGKQRNYFTQWLARSALYRPKIEAELKKAGLPKDLVYLAMIESGFNPSAYSHADACGLWQFIEGTGTRYGLKVDSWVDERREPEKATKAAVRYLAKLYNQFDNWYLAVAAYNAGEKKIDTAMKNYNCTDFWEVAASNGIFMETKRYVPKLIAAIIIARNPEKYGFTDIPYKKPHEYDTITVPSGASLDAVAATANISVKELRSLNNELRRNQTPPKQNDYVLRIPVGTKELIAGNLDKLRPVTTTTFITHVVKKGDTLASICGIYNVSRTTLLKANNIRTADLPTGRRLQIPTTTTKYALAKETPPKEDRMTALAPTGKQRQVVLHTLKNGDTLEKIAKQYQVSGPDILQWNRITNLSQVKQGQQIALHLGTPAVSQKPEPTVAGPSKAIAKIAGDVKTAAQKDPEPVPTLEASGKRLIARVQPAPEPSKKQPAPAQTTKQEYPPIWYVVKHGDTLVTVAKKFQASPQDIRDWNKLSTNTLTTGNKLIVKKG